MSDPVWRPDPGTIAAARITRFARDLGLTSHAELERFAEANVDAFWSAAADHLGLRWQRRPSRMYDLSNDNGGEWFVAGQFNIADNALDRWVAHGRGDEPSIVSTDESGISRRLTWRELETEVRLASAALRCLGVDSGDRVAIQLPMGLDVAVVTLACARIGAVVVPLFSGFGEDAAASRIERSEAVLHVVTDGYSRRGRWVDAVSGARAARARCGSSVRTVVVRRRDTTLEPGEVDWHEVCDGVDADSEDAAAAQLSAGHPLMLAFTSGTTGPPKGVTLSQAGFALKAGTDAALFFDLKAGDVACWVTDPGWVMFPITLLGGLIAGCAVALFAGAPDHPTADALWRFVDSQGVSFLGVSPTLVRALRNAAPAIRAPESVRTFGSSGEPFTPDAFEWLFNDVGRGRVPVINYSGGTEVSGGILANCVADPIHVGGFARAIPGMAADVVDDEANSVVGQPGELVLRQPSPGMPTSFLDGDTYRSRWPQLWAHGDLATRLSSGRWVIHGRSDDTLKIAGKRIGPAEVESAASSVPGVVECAAVGVPDPVKGQRLVVFAEPSDDIGIDHRAKLPGEVTEAVSVALGRALRPAQVHLVAHLPRTRSGKIVRRAIGAVYAGRTVSETSLANPDSLNEIRSIAARAAA